MSIYGHETFLHNIKFWSKLVFFRPVDISSRISKTSFDCSQSRKTWIFLKHIIWSFIEWFRFQKEFHVCHLKYALLSDTLEKALKACISYKLQRRNNASVFLQNTSISGLADYFFIIKLNKSVGPLLTKKLAFVTIMKISIEKCIHNVDHEHEWPDTYSFFVLRMCKFVGRSRLRIFSGSF